MKGDFADLLVEFLARIGMSKHALALSIGVDSSYVVRLAHGDREPPRQHIVEAMARGLGLSLVDRNRFLLAAGHAPVSLTVLGDWDDDMQAYVDVRNDPFLSSEQKAEFCEIVRLLARQYRRTASQGQPLYQTWHAKDANGQVVVP